MKSAQIAPLAESVPPRLYGGTERVGPCAPRALRLDPGASSTVILRRPRLPQFLRRHDGSVAVNLLEREGSAEVEVMLQE